MEKKRTFDLHLNEELLEEYCFNRLPEPQTAAVEEHLLICPSCQRTLQELDEYILLMRVATAEFGQLSPENPERQVWERGRELALRQSFAWNA